MGYETYLWRMLEPLGVYSGGGYSGAELKALGAALDQAETYLTENSREMFPMTAAGDGLTRWKGLYPFHSLPETAEETRDALKTLSRVDHSAFTAFAVEQTLQSLGLNVGLVEQTPGWVVAVFRGTKTREDDLCHSIALLERVLPCHLYVECSLTYVAAATGELTIEKQPLDTLRKRTKGDWDSLIAA